MEEARREVGRLSLEVRHLENLIDELEETQDEHVAALALSVAKRARKSSTLTVRALARIRETLQS